MKDIRKYQAVFVIVILAAAGSGASLFAGIMMIDHQQLSWAQLSSDDETIEVSIPSGASTLTDTAYRPNPVEVTVGETVVWTNDDAQPHTATSGSPIDGPDGKFGGTAAAPVILVKAQTQEFTFTEAGEYDYYCILHPSMVGTVVVSNRASTIEPAQPAQGEIPQEPPSFSVPGLNASSSEETMDLQEAKQLYLSAWNNTQFNATFSTFVKEGSALGYGVYEEHAPENTFGPGETIVLYAEVVGFAHEPLVSEENNTGDDLYQMAFTADYTISDNSSGIVLQRISDVPVGTIISHRQNTELFIELTLTQESPFPEGDYAITYVVNDTASGEAFELTKNIRIADTITSSSSSPSIAGGEASTPSGLSNVIQNPPPPSNKRSDASDRILGDDDDGDSPSPSRDADVLEGDEGGASESSSSSPSTSNSREQEDHARQEDEEEKEENPPEENGCDPAYLGVCIPSPPPDLDCGDVPYDNFRVRSSDPHRFDNDDDGRGCES